MCQYNIKRRGRFIQIKKEGSNNIVANYNKSIKNKLYIIALVVRL